MAIDIEDFGPIVQAAAQSVPGYAQMHRADQAGIDNQILSLLLPSYQKLIEIFNDHVVTEIHSFLGEEWEKVADDPVRNVIEAMVHDLFGTSPDEDGLTLEIYRYMNSGGQIPIHAAQLAHAPCSSCGEKWCDGADGCKGYRFPPGHVKAPQNETSDVLHR